VLQIALLPQLMVSVPVPLVMLVVNSLISSNVSVCIGVADIDMGICDFWHCGFLLRLPVMSGSTQFVIQQFLP
jgi:hypothetical protein